MGDAHQGPGRQFYAFARPNGDTSVGISGPLVEIHERLVEPGRGRRTHRSVRVLSHAEAAHLHYELGQALRAFDLVKRMAVAVAEQPRAATDPYSFRDHGTLADVGFMDASGECAT